MNDKLRSHTTQMGTESKKSEFGFDILTNTIVCIGMVGSVI